MACQTLHRQWSANPWLTKRYADYGLNIHGSPNATQTMVCASSAHQSLRRQWFEHTRLTKRYAANGLNIHGSPNGTQTIVCGSMAYQTLCKQWLLYHPAYRACFSICFCNIRLILVCFLNLFLYHPACPGLLFYCLFVSFGLPRLVFFY